MHRFTTLNRSLLVALPFAALLAACGGQAGEPSSDPNAEAQASGTAVVNETENKATNEGENTDENAALPTEPTILEEGETPVVIKDDGAEDVVAEGPEQLNADGSPISESGVARNEGPELGSPYQVEGVEAEAQGAETVALTAEGDDGIAQTDQALTTPRRTTYLNEVKRQYNFLKESTSYYSHTTYMNESTGTRRTDCSGYMGYALTRVFKSVYDKLNSATDGMTPKSEDYYSIFMSSPTTASTNLSTPRWRKISRIRDLKPGDILVIRYPSWMTNTGHTMVVRDYPRTGRTSKNEVLVPIYDSTSSPHSYNVWDSRGTSRSGIGAGTIGIKVDSTGKGVGYYWSGGTSGSVVMRSMVGGRLE